MPILSQILRNVLFFLIVFLVVNCTENNKTKENEVIARTFIEACSIHDINKVVSLFIDSCLYEEVARGRKLTNENMIARYLNGTIGGVPDTKFDMVSVIANDTSAMIEWIWRGTNTVGWESLGIPATNKYFEVRGVSVMTIENGLIKRNSEYWDWNTMLTGMGIE